MNDIRFILFDAANTLIYKPDLWGNMSAAIAKHGIHVDAVQLKLRHKIISEIIRFPDNTSSDFYRTFNSELLYALGIIPTGALLTDIFTSCTYLDWQPFEDTSVLPKLSKEMGVLSNFNRSLFDKVSTMFPGVFSKVITSEELECAKPAAEFYDAAVKLLGCEPKNILYIGDSIKLDMEPALKAGLNAFLIDRDNFFPDYPNRLKSLDELLSM